MSDKIVSKPLSLIEKEAKEIQERYHPDFLFIRDENFPLQSDWKQRLETISSIIPQAKIYLFASSNLLNEENIIFMKKNNVYLICLGLEDVTVSYGKNMLLDLTCSLLKKHGIYIYLSFIVNPLKIVGKENGINFFEKLMDRLYQLGPEMICGNFLMPFRGTKIWDEYYQYVSPEDYKYYDSKSAFLVRNPILRKKMEYFMFRYQWIYFNSEFYNKIRNFNCGDTLNKRFIELYSKFDKIYKSIYNQRC